MVHPANNRASILASIGLPTATGCREWKGKSQWNGYGQISVHDTKHQVHRLIYMMYKGTIPTGYIVRHKCDNRICVNPYHLELGTHADNSRDMVERGRSTIGERAHTAILTEQQAKEIIVKAEAGIPQKNLVQEYGVSKTAISNVVRGKTWRHLQRSNNSYTTK